ncbi:MAG: hypothetical protein F6K14_01490 [Symploca sp. SIO2C1]|nr:hypothetical protein [Symploca sp. SIO2C1]
MVLETYRHQFPQLWEDHDLIVRFEQTQRFSYSYSSDRRAENQVEPYSSTSTVEYATRVNLANQDAALSLQQELPLPDNMADQGRGTQVARVKPDASDALGTKDRANNLRSLPLSPSESRAISPKPGSQSTVGYVLRLFISGHSETTEDILKNLHQLLENSLRHPYSLKIIDIFKHPEQAEENQISATPTLLRVWPLPARRIVGDFNNPDKILQVLIAPSQGWATEHISQDSD